MTTTTAGSAPAGRPRTAQNPDALPGRDVLRARYLAATTTPREYSDSRGITLDNSRDWYRVDRALRQWAATTAGGEVHSDERDSLEDLVDGIFAEAERRILEWAEGIGR